MLLPLPLCPTLTLAGSLGLGMFLYHQGILSLAALPLLIQMGTHHRDQPVYAPDRGESQHDGQDRPDHIPGQPPPQFLTALHIAVQAGQQVSGVLSADHAVGRTNHALVQIFLQLRSRSSSRPWIPI